MDLRISGPYNGNAVSTLWTFPNETWIENLAIRSNGAALCTSLNRAAIYQVDPFSHVAETVHQFSSTDGVLGISEIANEVFAVVTANVSLVTNEAWPGSAKIWRVDVGAWEAGASYAVSLIANMSEIRLPDGVATLPNDVGVVLVADAAQGTIWRVNTNTAASTLVIDDPLFKPTDAVPLGVNGIHIQKHNLYFTNLATNSVGKMSITADGNTAGPVQILTNETLVPDDFALADDGTVYVAGYNTLWQVMPDGETTALLGGPDSTVVQGITSARLGRTDVDKNVVYMATQGGMFLDPPGSPVHGGQLLAVSLGSLTTVLRVPVV